MLCHFSISARQPAAVVYLAGNAWRELVMEKIQHIGTKGIFFGCEIEVHDWPSFNSKYGNALSPRRSASFR
jgi:hypothetical protein